MFLNIITTGIEAREFNGPVLLPQFDGVDGLRAGQLAYDNSGLLDGTPGLIVWDGSQWLKVAVAGSIIDFGDGVTDSAGNGIPEGVVSAAPASTYRQKDGVPGSVFWVKQSGTGNTGWAPIG